MYIGATKPHTAHVVEHTFLLCKPDAEQYHRYILQTVSDAGFQVLAKSFIITPSLAEEIASTFPSVRRSMYAERGVEKLLSAGKTATGSSPTAASGGSAQPMTTASTTTAGNNNNHHRNNNNNNSSTSSSANDTDRRLLSGVWRREQHDAHHGIIAQILELTSRNDLRCDGVNAGLPTSNNDNNDNHNDDHNHNHNNNNKNNNNNNNNNDHQPRQYNHNTDGLDVEDRSDMEMSVGGDAVAAGRPTNTQLPVQFPQREHKTDRRIGAAAALKNTMIEALSYQDLLREHVQHLAVGGTCMAVELSRDNAVERLLEIVGPENPMDARRVAPNSIRARLGRDLIRNAVHAASNLAEASHCISAVFGFATHYAAADIRTHTALLESGGAEKDDRNSGGAAACVRPCCELVCLPHRGPLKLGKTVRAEKTNPQAHVAYYTGKTLEGESTEREERENNAKATAAAESRAWQQKAEQLEQELAQERMELVTHAKLLRARELDLLLREHALEKATQGLFAPPQPYVQQGQGQQNFPELPEGNLEDQVPPISFLPPILSGRQSTLIPYTMSELTPGKGLAAMRLQSQQRRVSPGISAQIPFVMAPVVEAEDISLLLTKPVRLRALYAALLQFSGSGELLREDVVALYNRSPAVQLFWLDNHHEFFEKYVDEHTEEPVSFDSFVSVLMFLLKQ